MRMKVPYTRRIHNTYFLSNYGNDPENFLFETFWQQKVKVLVLQHVTVWTFFFFVCKMGNFSGNLQIPQILWQFCKARHWKFFFGIHVGSLHTKQQNCSAHTPGLLKKGKICHPKKRVVRMPNQRGVGFRSRLFKILFVVKNLDLCKLAAGNGQGQKDSCLCCPLPFWPV